MEKFHEKVSLEKGDVIELTETEVIVKWIVDEPQEMHITGNTNDNGKSIFDYKVIAPCIRIPKDAYESELEKVRKGDGELYGSVHMLSTFTDIGGHYLRIVRDNQELKRIHLHNGFGDGHYHLRFTDGMLLR